MVSGGPTVAKNRTKRARTGILTVTVPDDFDDPEGREDLDQPPAFFPYEGREPEAVDLVEVQVEGVYEAQADGSLSRFVIVTDGTRRLPIKIGGFEAHAIQMARQARRPDRPLTHDLLRNLIERLEATLDRVVIDDFWNAIYYAKLYLRKGDSEDELEIDARPSDAIALAVRMEAPVYVSDAILDQGMIE